LADEIAAVGVVSGGFMEPIGGCRPSRPMPVIAFHGTGDGIVPYGGTRRWPFPIEFPSVPAWTQAWAERDGCAPAPVTTAVSAHVQEMHYGPCRGGADVVLYTIEGGGHAWPGGEELPQFIAGFTTQEIDATRILWDFFSAHARPPAKPTTPRRTAVNAPPAR
jgi:polyhydroxybutyrate depolymerase